MKIVKISYHNDPPPITAPANKGQNLQVPSRPLFRGYTVLKNAKKMFKNPSGCDFFYDVVHTLIRAQFHSNFLHDYEDIVRGCNECRVDHFHILSSFLLYYA